MQKRTQQTIHVSLSTRSPSPPGHLPRETRSRWLWVLAAAGLACVPIQPRGPEPIDAGLYQMPNRPSDARSPEEVRPDRAPELAEAALGLLDPKRTGGPDYSGAARMCLMAAEIATPVERELRGSCYRVAARSALRSGDRQIYLEAVDAWERNASRIEFASGELLIHTAIRNRLRGLPPDNTISDALLRQFLDQTGESEQ